MEQFFVEIVNRGLMASLLVLVVLLIRLVFRSAPKRFWCVLWALVGFRLLCPVSVESAFSLMPDMHMLWQDAGEGQNVVNEEQDEDGISVNVPLYPENIVTYNEIIGPGKITKENLKSFGGDSVISSTSNPDVVSKAQDPLQSSAAGSDVNEMPVRKSWQNKLHTVAIYLWLAGLSAMLIYGAMSLLKVKQQVKVSLPRETQRSEDSESQRTVFGRMKKERIYYCDTIETPFAFGIFRPGIYLPSGLDEVTTEYVLWHEKEHLKYKDQWWKALGFLLLAVYWFHPLLWVAYLFFCKDLEYACDERVIQGMEEEQRKNYAEALLNCSIGKRGILFCPTAFGETSVKGRIKSILTYKKATVPVIFGALVLVLVLGAVFLTDPSNEKAELDALERWDGANWRVLSKGSWQDASYAIKNGNMWKIDLAKEWQQYGEGLYIPGDKKIEERIPDVFLPPVPTKASETESTADIIKVYAASEKEGRLETYYKLADGTWKTEKHHYQYRIELTGRMNNAASDSTFVCLSNSEDISFSEVARSMLSSNLADHLDRAEVVLVELH